MSRTAMLLVGTYYSDGTNGKPWKHVKGKRGNTDYRRRHFKIVPNDLEMERSKKKKRRYNMRKADREEKYEDKSCVMSAPAPAPAPAPICSASDIAAPFVANVLAFLQAHCTSVEPKELEEPEEPEELEESEESEESDGYDDEDYMEPSNRVRGKVRISPYSQTHARKCAERASRKGVQTLNLEKRVDKGKKH